MRTGFEGTFVMSWAQTELDGLMSAPRAALGPGAIWRWSGDALRIDGPRDLMRLSNPKGGADLHARAARKVRRLAGLRSMRHAGLHPGVRPWHGRAALEGVAEDGAPPIGRRFEVTDGYRSYVAGVVDHGHATPPLLTFSGVLPPADTDLWVVRVAMDPVAMHRVLDQPTGVICFTPGTRVRTARGDRLVEEIAEGDRIQTKDNGLQEVLWKGAKRVSGARLYAMPELRPVRLRQGALGIDRPDEDLVVSPAHRMLVCGATAQALFNVDEVLVTARDLIDDHRVVRDHSLSEVTYVHLLLPRHEVVFANGLETESFHPAGEALDSVDPAARARLIGLMPDVGEDPMAYGAFVRRALSRAEAEILRGGRANGLGNARKSRLRSAPANMR